MLHGEKMPFDNITTMKQEQEVVILKIQSTKEKSWKQESMNENLNRS